jgi:hypothetical protein
MSRGGWKSVAMVVHYEHTSQERDALLAQALNPYAEAEMWSLSESHSREIAHVARADDEAEGEVPPNTTADRPLRSQKLRGRDSNSQPSG